MFEVVEPWYAIEGIADTGIIGLASAGGGGVNRITTKALIQLLHKSWLRLFSQLGYARFLLDAFFYFCNKKLQPQRFAEHRCSSEH
jgi:hypothetical protein